MYKEKEKDITIKSFELEKYREDIIYLCKKLKIEDLEIDTVHELGVNAYTTIVNDSKPSIKFTYGFINALRHVSYQKGDLAMDETFRAILSHELIHIVYQDPLRIRVRARNAVLVALGFLFFILIVVSWGKFMPLILGIFIPILFLYIICFGIICDVRYWGQISELRADKKGMKVADVSEEAFDNYWEFARSIEREAAAIRRIESSNFIYKRYKRYVEIEFHPSIERRQQSLKKGVNWGSYDYVEQLLLILKWKSSGKGWNGR